MAYQPREKYILHFTDARLALWYQDNTLTIGGHTSLGRLVSDIFIVAFNCEPPEWEQTSQSCKCRSSKVMLREQFNHGMKRLAESEEVVVQGPLKSLGRIAI